MTFIDIINTAVLALIMFSIGASMTFEDVKRVFAKPKAPLLGIFLQMVFLPVLGFVILLFTNLDPFLKAGIFMVTLCPGGTTSNFISYLVNADIALSVAMTSVNSLLILLSIPILANLGLNYYLGEFGEISIPVGQTILQVFGIILVPAIMGIQFNQHFANWSQAMRQPLKIINIVLLAIVFLIRGLGDPSQGGSGINSQDIFDILPVALAVHLASMIGSYLIVKTLKFPDIQAITIGIEVGLQNTALALLVTGTLVNNANLVKPAIVFALFSFFTTLLFAVIGKRFAKTTFGTKS